MPKPKAAPQKSNQPAFRKEWVIWLRVAAAGLLTLVGCLLPEGLGWLRILLHVIAYLSLSIDLLFRVISRFRKGQILTDPMLVILPSFVMFFLGLSFFAPLTLMLYRSCEALRAEMGARLRKKNSAPGNLLPQTTIVLRNGQELELPSKRVRIGDTVLVRQGDPVPLDGVVLEGESELSVARLTGETRPVTVTQGDRVFAGSVNGISVIMIRVTAAEEDSAINQIRRITYRAREERSKTEELLGRMGTFFTCAVAAAFVLLIVLPLVFLRETEPKIWLGRAMAMLSTGGVSALLYAVSAAYSRVAAKILETGCAVTSNGSIDTLAQLSLAIIDKAQISGTECSVVSAVTTQGVDLDTLNRCASIVYYHYDDNISHSLRRFCGDVGYAPDKYREIPGYGVSASFAGQMIHAGSSAYLERMGIRTVRTGANTLHIALDKSALGYYILSEALRPEAKALFSALRDQGLKTALFSPDPKETALADAASLGAEISKGDMLSREKGAELHKLRDNHPGFIAFVGGVGDTGALRSADIGILCDGLRNTAGVEPCGAILLSAVPEALPEVIRCARRGRKDMLRYLGAGVTTKLLLPILCALGLLPLPVAVALDGISTIVLTMLAVRVAEYRGD